MAVEFIVTERGNPSDPTAPKKYYAHARSTGEIGLRQISDEVAEISTVSPIDSLASLEGFIQLMNRHLPQGKIVRLGDFGSFYLTVNSTGSETPEEVNSANIKNIHIRFRPGKQIARILKTLEFKKAVE